MPRTKFCQSLPGPPALFPSKPPQRMGQPGKGRPCRAPRGRRDARRRPLTVSPEPLAESDASKRPACREMLWQPIPPGRRGWERSPAASSGESSSRSPRPALPAPTRGTAAPSASPPAAKESSLTPSFLLRIFT